MTTSSTAHCWRSLKKCRAKESLPPRLHSADGRQLAVYEVNLHTTGGDAPQAVLDRFTPSAAAGLAVAGHMLRMMRDHGVRDEMLFSLPQYQFGRSDGKTVRLWGSVVEMGANGRKRPQFLAESLANRVLRGDMVRVDVTGENPTHDQPPGNDGVSLRDAHELDAYGFQDGKWHGLIVFNYGLHRARRVCRRSGLPPQRPGPVAGDPASRTTRRPIYGDWSVPDRAIRMRKRLR